MAEMGSILAQWASAGAGMGGAFFVVRWFFEYVGGRMDKRAAAIDSDTRFLIEGLKDQISSLTKRVGHVEGDLADCKDRHARSEAEVAFLTATLQGLGEGRELAAMFARRAEIETQSPG